MSRCYDLVFRLYKRYKFYKNRCHELTLQVEEMQRAIDGYCTSSGGDIQLPSSLEIDQQSGSLKTSTFVKSSPKVPRKHLFSTPDKNCYSGENEIDFEPGSNKWECIDGDDWKNYSLLNNDFFEESEEATAPKTNSSLVAELCDRDKTFFEPQENLIFKNEVTKPDMNEGGVVTPSKMSKISSLRGDKRREKVYLSKPASREIPHQHKKANNQLRGNEFQYSPGHICKYPRCPKHQPFFVSSLCKIAKLSPQKKALATNQRSKSPKGFWDLEMPSTQFIRSRHQEKDCDL